MVCPFFISAMEDTKDKALVKKKYIRQMHNNILTELPQDVIPCLYEFLDERSLSRLGLVCAYIYTHQYNYYNSLRKSIINNFMTIPHSIHIDKTMCTLLSAKDILSADETEKTFWIKPDSVTVNPFCRLFSAIVQDNNNPSKPLLIQGKYNAKNDHEDKNCKNITIQAIHALEDLSCILDNTNKKNVALHYCRDINASRLLISSFTFPDIKSFNVCRNRIIHYIDRNGRHRDWICSHLFFIDHIIQIDKDNNFCIQEDVSPPSDQMIIDSNGNITRKQYCLNPSAGNRALLNSNMISLSKFNYVPTFKRDMCTHGHIVKQETFYRMATITEDTKKIRGYDIPLTLYCITPKNDLVWTSNMITALIKTFNQCRGVYRTDSNISDKYSAEDCARAAVALYKGGNRDWVTLYRDTLIKRIWVPMNNTNDINPLGEQRMNVPIISFMPWIKRYHYQQDVLDPDQEAALCEELLPLEHLATISLEPNQTNEHGTNSVDHLIEELKNVAKSKIPEEIKQAHTYKPNFIYKWYTLIKSRFFYMHTLQSFALLAKPLSWLYAPIQYMKQCITQWT
jgi:hypothetical protein